MVSGKERKRTWERRVEKAKKDHRPKLKNWRQCEFTTLRKNDFLELRYINQVNDFPIYGKIDTIAALELSYQDFVKRYEEPSIPVVISNIPEVEVCIL